MSTDLTVSLAERRQWTLGEHAFWTIFTVFALVLVAWVVWFVAVHP